MMSSSFGLRARNVQKKKKGGSLVADESIQFSFCNEIFGCCFFLTNFIDNIPFKLKVCGGKKNQTLFKDDQLALIVPLGNYFPVTYTRVT